MRAVVLTSRDRGFASFALPILAERRQFEIAAVVHAESQVGNRKRNLKRKLRKLRRIGPLGTLVGFGMRRWFTEDVGDLLRIRPVEELTRQLGIPYYKTPTVNSDRTVSLLSENHFDVGLSLGNPFIAPRIFTIPHFGMLNVHHELLPDFRGAGSVIWQIHEGNLETGYTIHRIDEHIDTGGILRREILPIEFKPKLRETVVHNLAGLYQSSARGLCVVLQDFHSILENSSPQSAGTSFTTPTFRQFRRMIRENRKQYKVQEAAAAMKHRESTRID